MAQKYNLDVDQGISDYRLYVQKGTPNGPQYSCEDPSLQFAIGRQLASTWKGLNFFHYIWDCKVGNIFIFVSSDQKYDVKSVYKPGGLCALAKQLARIFAGTPATLIFSFGIFSIIPRPCTYAYQFNSWFSRIADYGIFQSLFAVCWTRELLYFRQLSVHTVHQTVL